MLENWQTLASIGGVVSLALFLVPGSIFYALMQNYAFRSGRYNFTPLTKLFIISFISLLILVFTVHLSSIPLLSAMHDLCSKTIKLINPINLEQLSNGAVNARILLQNISILTEGILVSLTVGILLMLLFHSFQFIREHNIVDKYLHYPLLRFTEMCSKQMFYYARKSRAYFRNGHFSSSLKCGFSVILLTILINAFGLFLFFIFIIVILLYVIDFVFYNLGQLFNHPLHRSIHRWKKWKQVPIIEVKMNNGILYKGVLHSFEPKNRSEIESISLRNVISYIPLKDKLSLSPNNREEVYNFGHRQEFFTIPFSQIDNFNIWHFAGGAARYNSWTSTVIQNDIHIALWYLRLELMNYWYKSSPEDAIKFPYHPTTEDEAKITDLIIFIARSVDQCIPTKGMAKRRKRKEWYYFLSRNITRYNLSFSSELRLICRDILL